MAGAGVDILGHESKLVMETMHSGVTRWKGQTPGHSIQAWPAYLTFTRVRNKLLPKPLGFSDP